MYEKYSSMQHYQLHQEKIKYFIVLICTIFLLTINMCDRGRRITHLQILRFHTQVWYITVEMTAWFVRLTYWKAIFHCFNNASQYNNILFSITSFMSKTMLYFFYFWHFLLYRVLGMRVRRVQHSCWKCTLRAHVFNVTNNCNYPQYACKPSFMVLY